MNNKTITLTEKEKKQLCELAGVDKVELNQCKKWPCDKNIYCNLCPDNDPIIDFPKATEITYGDLHRAKDAINLDYFNNLGKKPKYHIECYSTSIRVIGSNMCEPKLRGKCFDFRDHNNDPEQALTAALKYVIGEMG